MAGTNTGSVGGPSPQEMDSENDEMEWLEFQVIDEATSEPLPKKQYTIFFSDGTHKSGKTDENGYVFRSNVPPGEFEVFIDSDKYKADTTE